MDLTHPEKCMEERYGTHYDVISKLWSDTHKGHPINLVQDFSSVFDRYVAKVEIYKSSFSDSTEGLTWGTPGFQSKVKRTDLYQRIVIEMLKTQVVQDFLINQEEDPSYSRMFADVRWLFLWELMQTPHTNKGQELATLHLELMIRHALALFVRFGQKVYDVSPGLEWQLANTELRNFPADEVHLPYPVIYLTLPRKYKVYNHQTGWHPAEGVYVVEDTVATPRAWRMILTAGPNENSPDTEDDALYHWTFLFPEGSTIEEAIQHTLAVAAGGADVTSRTAVIDGKEISFQTGTEGETAGFALMKDTLLEVFRYVMNVVLYCTMPDADKTLADANLEYARLRRRAFKCKAGTKRKDLFQRANKLRSRPRIVLGGSVVVDRSGKVAEDAAGTGRKHQVRTLVAGHWQRYWKGKKGEQVSFKKRKIPYWKGLEHAPLTRKKHVLKHRGE